MRLDRRVLPMLLLPLFATACATAAARLPLTDVPPGTYVMVEPASETYNAVTIGANSFSYRNGDETGTGQHWLDSDGRVHIVDDSGECAGQESIWTYQYTGNRISMTKVSDACAGREMPATMVYERR